MPAESLPAPDDTVNGQQARKPLFEGSTQFKNWRFSPERLHATRSALNASAVAAIRNTFEADLVRPYVFAVRLLASE